MMSQPPTEADVTRILALSDRALRNLCITQCYHDLAKAYATRVAEGANWCTFATWASRQAGQTIRGQDLERAVERALAGSSEAGRALDEVAHALHALGARADLAQVRRTVRQVLDLEAPFRDASEAVARGNARVFEEIGREFARFLAACGRDDSFDDARLAAFLEGLRPGEPPHGQDLLRQAFARYYRALFEPPGLPRAQRLLLANLEVGLHEQTRLQPEIRAALDAAVPDPEQIAPRLLRQLVPWWGTVARVRRFFGRILGGPTPLDIAVAKLVGALRADVRRAITDHLMTLALPRGVVLSLGDDLRAPFPGSLATLTDPDLVALLGRIDPTPDSTVHSGARDWADLPERMHYIADLFRCKQEATELFDAPFTEEQLAALRAGRLPTGPL